MALEFEAAEAGPPCRRRVSGRLGYLSGIAAEELVERDYARRGCQPIARRWRGRSGEVDLIFQQGDGLVFVEVKKSRSFDRALERLGQRQLARLMRAAEEFLATQPRGALTDVRFDVALVDGSGRLRVIENVLAF